jgi:hypothetical protein
MTCNICLAFFVWFLVPETKHIALEEIDVLFGGQNHTEKGGDLLNVEDPHHAQIGVDNVISSDSDKISSVVRHEERTPPQEEIKM